MANDKTTGSKPLKFIIPQISSTAYRTLTGPEFDDLCDNLVHTNRDWIRQNMPDINTTWVIVVGGKIVEESHSDILPSIYEVTRRSRGKDLAFLLTRPRKQYLGLELYFRNENIDSVVDLLKRDRQEVEDYRERVEGISFIQAQSGILNKLEDAFALGRMRYECPLLYGETEKRHHQGAYSATITHTSFQRSIRLASQSQSEINARGIKTLDQRQPERWIRMERLHRFDDVVIDMFDTYASKKQPEWPALVLYKDVSKPTL
jgi:hypothetical protein